MPIISVVFGGKNIFTIGAMTKFCLCCRNPILLAGNGYIQGFQAMRHMTQTEGVVPAFSVVEAGLKLEFETRAKLSFMKREKL